MQVCELCEAEATKLVWFMPGDTMLNAWVLCCDCAKQPLTSPGVLSAELARAVTFPPQVFASANFEDIGIQAKVLTAVISTLQELAGVGPS
ncbi:MAG: hypothetical protein GTN69_10505 [Armatimonadetes bacterium]|nr:hypothetical protein [Armatimonadota bacterium]